MPLNSITPEKTNQWWKKIVLLGLFFFLVGSAFYAFKLYQTYQKIPYLYVNNNYQGWLKLGLEKYPYDNISEAFYAASLKKTSPVSIHLKNGEYFGNIELPENIKIYGESRNGVIIKNADPLLPTIAMKNNSLLADLTVMGGPTAILAENQATIENCYVGGFKKIGIDAAASDSEIIVENSEISNSSGKGFYLQRGRKIQIIGNLIYKNEEEGIDLRQEISGEIKNNAIYENGESGIELIVGKSFLKIEENNIWDNGANGIVFQYYDEMPEKGSIFISANHIKSINPEEFAISVKSPSGGEGRVKNYWRDSITITADNVLDGGIKTRSLEITPKKIP